MKRFFVCILCVFFLSVNTLPVFAFAPGLSIGNKQTDEENAAAAGQILGDVIALILSQYAGGDVTAEGLYKAALRGMGDILDDYSQFMDDDDISDFTGSLSGRLTGIGVLMRTNEENQHEVFRVLPDTPAKEAGMKKGDILVTVNGKNVSGMTLSAVIDMILNPGIGKVTVSARRGSVIHTFEMVKRAIPSVTVFTEALENIIGKKAAEYKHIAYAAVNSISETTGRDLKKAVEQLKKDGFTHLILDLRGNSGGYLDVAVEICNLLVPRGPIFYAVDARGQSRTTRSFLNTPPFDNMAVLVDAHTASAAELITAALQDAGTAVVIGGNTFGKGVIQSLFTLPVGGGFKLTTEEFLRRNGKKLNGIGIIPDYKVEMKEMDYESPRDTGILKALEVLTK